MKLVIVAALALVACAVAAPAIPAAPVPAAPVPAAPVAPASPIAPVAVRGAATPAVNVTVKEPEKILRSEFDQEVDGKYNYAFETDNGITKEETGEVKTLTNEKNEPVNVIVVRGSYSYPDMDGQIHTVTYYADETGFHTDIEPKA